VRGGGVRGVGLAAIAMVTSACGGPGAGPSLACAVPGFWPPKCQTMSIKRRTSHTRSSRIIESLPP